jgi:hypothetical protein
MFQGVLKSGFSARKSCKQTGAFHLKAFAALLSRSVQLVHAVLLLLETQLRIAVHA